MFQSQTISVTDDCSQFNLSMQKTHANKKLHSNNFLFDLCRLIKAKVEVSLNFKYFSKKIICNMQQNIVRFDKMPIDITIFIKNNNHIIII